MEKKASEKMTQSITFSRRGYEVLLKSQKRRRQMKFRRMKKFVVEGNTEEEKKLILK